MRTPYVQRRDSIIATTIEVINEFGIQAFSTREVARREGITEAAVFKHFPRKNDLLLAVLNNFSLYDQDIVESARMRGLDPVGSILYMVELYTRYYENYPAITSIYLSYDVICLDPELNQKVQSILSSRYLFVRENIDLAKKQGLIRKEVDAELLTDCLLGTLKEICFRWRLSKYEFPLCQKSMEAVRMLLGVYYCNEKEN